MKRLLVLPLLFLLLTSNAQRAQRFITTVPEKDGMTLTQNNSPITLLYDVQDEEGIDLALNSLKNDLNRVTGSSVSVLTADKAVQGSMLIAGTINSKFIRQLVAAGKLSTEQLNGKREMFEISIVDQPFEGV